MRLNRAEMILKGLVEARARNLDCVILVKDGEHPSRRDRFELDGSVDELIEAFEAYVDRDFS